MSLVLIVEDEGALRVLAEPIIQHHGYEALWPAPLSRRLRFSMTLVRIEPEWRGFLYFVYEDEVVIVSPDDMKIVAVVRA